MVPMCDQSSASVFAKVASTSGIYGCFWLFLAGEKYGVIHKKMMGVSLLGIAAISIVSFVYFYWHGLNEDNQSAFRLLFYCTATIVIGLYLFFSWVAVSLIRILDRHVMDNNLLGVRAR